jgi:hypothetical protein
LSVTTEFVFLKVDASFALLAVEPCMVDAEL